MKVAIIHELLIKLGGAERVVKILADMFPKAPIYTLLYDEEKVGDMFPAKSVISSSLQKKFQRIRKPQPFLPYLHRAAEEFDFSGYDLVISSSSGFAHGIITPLHTKHVCYCHSPMRYAWDYTHQYRQDKSSGLLKKPLNFMISRMLKKVRIWDFVSSDRPDCYIAASKHVEKRIRKYYKQDSQVIYPPANLDRFSPKQDHDNFFLVVAALTAWKRIDLAVQAFNELGKTLIIIGDGQEKSRLEKMASPNIHFLGRQSDEVVTEYMRNCRAFIFPSEDDFGITPIEAMACGKPIIAYQKGGAIETIEGDKTGVFFPEQTKDSLKTAVSRFIDREESFKAEYIHNHAQQFSEERFINEIRDVINKI